MFKNYFKTAFRNLWRNRLFSIINIGGLTLGITIFLLITQYVSFEWNANRFNKNYEVLYRANIQDKTGNTYYDLPPGFAPVIKKQFPAIENYVRVTDGIADGVITYRASTEGSDRTFTEESISYVDGSFLAEFSFPIIDGNVLLDNPATMALSEPISRKLFGDAPAVGKTVTVSNQFGNTPYTVTAVYRIPEGSDIKSEVLLSLKTLESPANRNGNEWADPNGTDNGFTTFYFRLRRDANAVALANNITKYIRSKNPGSSTDIVYLQPFKEMHLAPSFTYPYQTFGNLMLVVVFSCVALLILVIAWVNYINLSTAQAMNRAKEVGVRKVLGASRRQLILQYLLETCILTISAAVIAVSLLRLLQDSLNQFTGKPLSLTLLNVGWFWLAGIALVLLGSLMSGIYVAFVLTSFNPVSTLRGKLQTKLTGISLRKGLVVFQFTISIVFIIATVILYRQLQFMQTENLGMRINQLLVVKGPTITTEGQAAKNVSFKNSLSALSFVKQYAASNNVPGIGYNFFANGIIGMNPTEEDKKKSYAMFICDQYFFTTFGISLAQGRTFTADEAEKSWNNMHSVIINEKAAQELGFDKKENIIGKKINWGQPYEIVGVVKDYHHLSLRESIKPTIYLASVSSGYFTVQTDTRDIQSKIATIKTLYNNTFPSNPFEYFFADKKYDQQYAQEKKLGSVFIASACIAILIACMGLFGLAAFSARQRVKEIGIRKILGASVTNITALLSKDFVRLVIIAIFIASPIAWWVMNAWLDDFAYRTPVNWWIFVIAGLIAVGIALLTVSVQAIKAAMANPVENMRSE